MAIYKTPGVYVEEISTLPPSVAEVATAVPAFIGYTAAGKKVARINTMLEYQNEFGQASPSQFEVAIREDSNGLAQVDNVSLTNKKTFLMYYALSHYFRNGGGSCYIISIGTYNSSQDDPPPPSKQDFIDGLTELEKEDEPTLILFPDATNLEADDYYEICQKALAQCNKLKDRFTILDVIDTVSTKTDANGKSTTVNDDEREKIQKFRTGIGINSLMYGAAYYPYLQTTLTYQYLESDISLKQSLKQRWQINLDPIKIKVIYTGKSTDKPKVKMVASAGSSPFDVNTKDQTLTIRETENKTASDIVTAWNTYAKDNAKEGFEITTYEHENDVVGYESNTDIDLKQESLENIKTINTSLYNQVKSALAAQRVALPPSAAMAGVYASVDRNRGVWKAPANVSLTAVIGPVTKINHESQENMNVDPTTGKSINAIRAFTGKGTLVWGARTLAGNDNEWRYISVRRLFNMIEESTQKATAFAVFEPNDMTTWLKVKAMIESYLYGLWEQGALAGSTPEAAYFINVGLGKTMTPQDILEGRMIVEIGIAAVRPAEFIILKFSHKLQEA